MMYKITKGGEIMLKKVILMGLVLSMLSTASVVFAADVYITANGKKYHKEVCRFIKNREVTKIDEKDAIAKGLEKCNKCFSTQELSKNVKGEK